MEGLGFRELQAQLPELLLHDADGSDLLVLPSLSFEPRELALVPGAHHYEERQLFELVRLRQPGNRVVYVTSKLLPELVVDMVLELLPGVPTSHARQQPDDLFSGGAPRTAAVGTAATAVAGQ